MIFTCFLVLLISPFLLSPALRILANEPNVRTVVFLGDSLTAGYGLSLEKAYPAVIEEKIAQANLSWRVINAGLSGDTSAGGLGRINWLMRGKIDILILALGANDALRGFAIEATKRNLQAIIDKIKKQYPDAVIIIAGMQAPPNMGKTYAEKYNGLFPELAKKNNTGLIPFLLEGVAAVPALNQADGIHPTEEGQKIVAQNVWKVLVPHLE